MMQSDMLMEILRRKTLAGHTFTIVCREYGELDDVTREARAKAKAWETSRAAIGGRRDVLGVRGRRVS